MANVTTSNEDTLDFSQPWEFSDTVLVVEENKFHAHRSVLSMWSPVFSTMFTAQFKEKTADEIPLPEKKATEIKELLLVIYPTSEREIDGKNFLILLNLAKEYMMTKLTQKCESFLLRQLEEPTLTGPNHPYRPPMSGFHCLELLDIAQRYELKKLEMACVEKAKGMRFDQLKRHEMYNKISVLNYQMIAEGTIEKMEREFRQKESEVRTEVRQFKSSADRLKSSASEALKDLENMISIIAFLVCKKDRPTYSDVLTSIKYSDGEFKKLYGPLSDLRSKLQSMSNK